MHTRLLLFAVLTLSTTSFVAAAERFSGGGNIHESQSVAKTVGFAGSGAISLSTSPIKSTAQAVSSNGRFALTSNLVDPNRGGTCGAVTDAIFRNGFE
jgi:hypothetical protein